MDCDIKPSEDGKYIILTICGDLTGERMLENILKSHALGKELGINRYLVDVTRSRNIDPPPENFSFARYQLKHTPGIDLSARIAALMSPGDTSHNAILTVSHVSGIDMTAFTDRHQAIAHLTKD